MNTLRQPKLVHASLQTPLQKVLDLKRKHVIEFHARFFQHADANQTANQGITLEEPFRVFFVQRKELTSRSHTLALAQVAAGNKDIVQGIMCH